jgi:hypothetical protein
VCGVLVPLWDIHRFVCFYNGMPFGFTNDCVYLHLLQDWDDDNLEDDFSQRLKAELAKRPQ